jgi:hypothetical protein
LCAANCHTDNDYHIAFSVLLPKDGAVVIPTTIAIQFSTSEGITAEDIILDGTTATTIAVINTTADWVMDLVLAIII